MKLKVNPKRFIIFIMCVLTVYISTMHYKASVDSLNIKSEQEKYLSLIEEEKIKNAELKEREKNLNTAESYEKIARENLGLLKSNEILFINSGNN